MINPDFLRTFLTLIETGHFTRTALRLHMTQPGVSQHIKKLEAHFQTELIQRTGKSFTITESGRLLVEYSKKLFHEYEAVKVDIGTDDPYVGECRYASPGSFGLRLFDVLLELAKSHPGLKVSLTVSPNASIPSLLLNRQIDMGFMSQKPDEALLEATNFSEEQLLLIVPRKKKIRTFADLKRLGFVNHPDGFLLGERLLGANFAKEFVSMNEINGRVFVNQISRILDPVAEGLGFTVLPEGAYRNSQKRDSLLLINLKVKVSDKIFSVRRKNERLPCRYQTVEASLIKGFETSKTLRK